VSGPGRSGAQADGPRASRLAGVALLADLPPDDLRALEQRCRWRRYRAGDLIVDRDSGSRDLFFVVEGRVRVVNYAPSGREIVYAVIEAGDYFGELAALDGEPRSAAVVALEPCLLAMLASEEFNALLLRHAAVAVAVLRRQARIIRRSDERIVDLSALSSTQRVARELLHHARPDADDPERWVVDPLPTQRSLADRAGTARETVARTLAHFADAGILRRRGRAVLILERERLEQLLLDARPEAGARRWTSGPGS